MDYYRKWLVETEWLAEHLDAPDVVILDGTCYLPIEERDADEEFHDQHIPGAQRFDFDDIADTSTGLPHMLPSPEKFSARVRKMGIGDGTRVVVYDMQNIFSASRVWWMFRTMGHEDVAVLNGGLCKWRAERRPMTEGTPEKRGERHFTARLNGSLLREFDDMKGLLTSGAMQIVDCRSAGRFSGKDPEPRDVPRLGRIPGSKHLPYQRFLMQNGTMKAPDEIRKLFAAAEIDPAKPMVVTCGSGNTACVLALAAAAIGHEHVAIYDGSWAEWSAADVPAEIG
ncbi:MAG: 3-mercaptopyruvate sulfurtransferase [Alphaproteobacteria bacterium]